VEQRKTFTMENQKKTFTEKVTSIEDFLVKQIRWVLAVLVVLIIVLGAVTCNRSKKADSLRKQLEQTFVVTKEKDKTIATQTQLLTTKDDALVKQIEKTEQLKNLKSQVTYKTVTVIEKVFVPLTDSTSHKYISVVDSVAGKPDTTNYMAIPALVSVDNNFYHFDGTIDRGGLTLDSLSIPDSTSVSIGDTKSLFKKQSIVRITHSNPFIKTIDMHNVVVDDESSKKQWKTFAIGGGVVLGLDAIIIGAYIWTHH